MSFVPDDFVAPRSLTGEGFWLEPLGPEHNEGDYRAWTSSIDHIRSTPGFEGRTWPKPDMTLAENLGDLERHAADFAARSGFTYTVRADGSAQIIGCVYIYPDKSGASEASGADVRSWVSGDRPALDVVLYEAVSDWLRSAWPFVTVRYATRLAVTISYRRVLRLLVMGAKIVVIGGGIGGLTTAIALARQGLAVEVYEQAPALKEVGAGVGLWPNAMAAFERIGLADRVARLAARVDRQGLTHPDGSWLLCLPAELMARRWGAGFVVVHRAELQQLLAAELDPAVIHLGARCIGFQDDGRGVTARFADGREVRADVLVGADGVHSAIRAALFGPAPLRYRGYTAVRSLTPPGSVPLPRDSWEIWGRGARFGQGPTGGDRVIWWATWNAPAGGKDDGDTPALLRKHFGTWPDPIPAIIEATPEAALVRNDIHDRRPARTWGRGRVVLVGDAIHPMTPDLAQGACQAIVDGVTLATCLAASGHPPAALRAYQRRRRRNAAVTALLARYIGAMGQWQGRTACAVRDTLMRTAPLSVQLRQLDMVLDLRRATPSRSR